MTLHTIPDLGTIGTVDGILRPLDIVLTRNGAAWDLTGYTTPTAKVWVARTGTAIATPGTVTVVTASTGLIRWTPAAGVYAASGRYEARFLVTPGGGGDPEPSGLFRFTIREN